MQSALFHERIEDALDEVIRCCVGRKAMAVKMWPLKPQREAHNLMDACLNPERRERFTPDQVLYILRCGREVGCHAAMHYLNAESGYAPAEPIDPENEIARLQREFIQASKSMSKTADRIEQLMGSAPALRRAI